jgi:hypothetical protein
MSSLSLFGFALGAPTSDAVARLATPFGDVSLSVVLDGTAIGGGATPAYCLGPEARLLVWETSAYRVELVVTTPPPAALRGPPVVGAALALWRVRAEVPVAECMFTARWTTGRPPGPGGPACGEFFAAATWQAGDTEVTLGAPDAEGLSEYERLGVVLPATWRALLHDASPTMTFVEDFPEDGLLLRLPALAPGEVAHSHVSVAWADAGPDDAASWFGADPSLREVFAELQRAAV